MNNSNSSKEVFKKSCKYIPGGVNSPVRSFNNVGLEPILIKSAKGAFLYSLDNDKYLDFICSWGAIILGHSIINKDVINEQLDKGLSYGLSTLQEAEFAELLCNIVPNLEQVRLTCSGTEATMSLIRLARGFTNRKYIVKFIGCYHGHSDDLLVESGSHFVSIPNTKGVFQEKVEYTLTAPYNDIDAINNIFKNYGKDIAGILVEPIAGNMGMIPSTKEFLKTLRKLCDDYESLLIFDEVMSGFRVSLKGSQDIYNINADLIALGKVIGGGLPLAAYGGKKEIMSLISPVGPVYQAGTLAGNPLAVRVGFEVIKSLNDESYNKLNQLSSYITQSLTKLANKYKLPFCVNYQGGMFGYCFSEEPIYNLQDVKNSNQKLFLEFYKYMVEYNILFTPSLYEANFISLSHSQANLDECLQKVDLVFDKISKN